MPTPSASFAGSLTPLSPPTALTEHTVVVGGASTPAVPAILRSFERTLSQDSEDPALVVSTSGSTGAPKQTVLSARALRASGRATEEFSGVRNAQWILCLPTHYVAGAQVLARSVLAGTSPEVMRNVNCGERFTAEDFMATCEQMTAQARMVSLVPAQLHTLCEAATDLPEVLPALREFNGILLGGAPAPAELLATARHEGLRVFTTYGSAETSGGCVYSGTSLPGVSVHVEGNFPATAQDPQPLWLGGNVVASGYLNDTERTAQRFFIDTHGTYWYHTDDVGFITENKLQVAGRADDVIITGGVKVSPGPIREVLETHPAVREALVCGVDDARWGTAVVAAVSVRGNAVDSTLNAETTWQELAQIIQRLEPAQRPKLIELYPAFPTLSTGKTDRRALQNELATTYRRRRSR